MSLRILAGATELGLIYGLMALGVYIAYRVLDFPDLSVDGSITLGAAVAAVLISRGYSPWASLALAPLVGALAGTITGLLHTRLQIAPLLAGILTMTGLYSINLRIMGRANISLLGTASLLNAIAGVWPLAAGSIILDGREITSLPGYKRADLIGRVFQDPIVGTASAMTIEENLAIAAKRGCTRGLKRGLNRNLRGRMQATDRMLLA